MLFQTFDTWDAVLNAAKTGARLWYHAPMDNTPCSIEIVKVFKNGKIRVRGPECCYTFDARHLSRMRHMVP